MTTKTLKTIVGLMLGLCIILTASQAEAKKKQLQPAELNSTGEKLLERYTAEFNKLHAELSRSLPAVNKSLADSYTRAIEQEVAAKKDLEKAQAKLGEIGKAKGLVGHATGHWIPKAERGIKAAQAKLKNAKTPAEREAAQKELEKWQKNKADGEQALRERKAAYEKAKQNEPAYKREVEQAKREVEQARKQITASLDRLRLDRVLTNDRLDTRLAKYVMMKEATPRNLAAFAQQSSQHRALIDQLLADDVLLLQMLKADGAQDGNYGQAMAIYTDILKNNPKAKDGIFQKLALAIALEHATPIKQKNPEAANNAPEFVDPIARYKHYEQAYLNEELDPYFKVHSPWALRFVVNGEEPDETLTWGREMLRNYRPDHITTKDDRWRYVALVRTCIRYGSEENKYDKPELQFYQNILMNGGICGRRAFIGRFILRAFGVPTVAKPQKGHAALGRWTPDGWVAVLGAGWNTGWAPKREMAAIDFLAITQARATGEPYMQVKRAQWIGDLNDETRTPGLNSGKGKPEFWNSIALNTQQEIIANSGAKDLGAVGEELGEANESKIKYPFESAEITDADRKISANAKGVITIPAAAASSPTKSQGKVRFLDSVLGGKQIHYSRTGGGDVDIVYTFDAPKAGKYDLAMLVSTPSWKQHLFLKVNGGNATDIELPHTVGMWDTTKPMTIDLKKGSNTLTLSRKGVKQQVAIKGFSLKELTLTPR